MLLHKNLHSFAYDSQNNKTLEWYVTENTPIQLVTNK